jgi:hypothetical protein
MRRRQRNAEGASAGVNWTPDRARVGVKREGIAAVAAAAQGCLGEMQKMGVEARGTVVMREKPTERLHGGQRAERGERATFGSDCKPLGIGGFGVVRPAVLVKVISS